MTRALGASVVCWICIALAAPVCSAADASLSGVVLDPLGAVIRDAEVFFLSETPERSPVAEVRSDLDGRFVVAGLAPGLYRVAAVKEGYDLYLGRINTALHSTLSVILQPLPPAGSREAAVVPSDPSWVLRVPARSVLRETEAGPATVAAAEEGAERIASPVVSIDSLRGSVDHSFAVAAPGLAHSSQAVQGTDTRMAIRSLLGRRYSVRVDGRKESLQSLAAADVSDDGEEVGRSDRTSVGVGLQVQATPEADLRFQAYYASHEQAFSPLPGSLDGDLRRAAQSWGYDAGWTHRFDDATRLDVTVDYRDAALAAPMTAGLDPVLFRSVGAAGNLETHPSQRHRLSVAFRAQHLDGPMAAIGGPSEAGLVGGVAGSGWTVRVEAEDHWTVAGPFTLVYGLGYRHTLSAAETSVLVPKAGGAWTSRFVNLRLLAAYHTFQDWDRGGTVPPSGPMQDVLHDAIGLSAEVEAFLTRGLSLQGTYSSAPVQFDHVGYGSGSLSSVTRPIYVTDGHADNQDVSLALVHQGPDARVYLQYATGKARGTLAPVSSFELPVQLLSEAGLRYHGGRAGVRVGSSGTDVGVEFRRQREAPLEAGTTEEHIVQRLLELRLLQELLRVRGGASWRLLFAFQYLDRKATDVSSDRVAYAAEVARDSHHRLNAGISVAF